MRSFAYSIALEVSLRAYMSYSKQIFAFYFVLFFILSFAWMDLSRSEFDTTDDEYFSEQRVEPSPNPSRTPNTPTKRIQKPDPELSVISQNIAVP